VVAVAALVSAGPAVGAAPARPSRRTYQGTSHQRLAVRLITTRSGAGSFRYQARLQCSDGSTFTDDAFTDDVTLRHDRFGATVSTSAGAVSTRVTGIVIGSRARGSIRIVERFSEIPDGAGDTPLDANGGIVCDSHTVRWTARASR
jgi:hypothetical protein